MNTDAVVTYLGKVKAQHSTGQATEHSYRGALAELMQSIDPELTVINEARRIECGSPDLTIMRGEVPVGYVEAKDVGLDIRKMKGANADQQKRYRDALPNLIYTNGLDFDFYRHAPDGTSERIADVSIADYLMGLQAKPQRFDALADWLTNFASGDFQGQTITSSVRLAKIMADKAKLIRDAFGKALVADKENETELAAQFLGFKETLIRDFTKAQFADIYAETIVYGMFAARYHDKTLNDFSREEAMELLPASNPFLKKLFQYVAVRDLDPGVRWAIDELVSVFRATNVNKIMNRWSDSKDKRDPFLHFYENFLAEYNPKKRKSRGVWYTPEPVVNFLVRAVDDVLKEEFGIADGLASTEKTTITRSRGQAGPAKRGKAQAVETFEEEVHRVQILDPATGTGTFLAEVIKQIEPRVKAAGSGVWSNYVEEHLIPRLHGFELLMASYAMCHMKLDMMLSDSGYEPSDKPPRLSVYLTNTLEEPDEEVSDLFMAKWLSDEARGANEVKREKPVMCIVGNPPYSGVSANKGATFQQINDLLKDYKKEPGGERSLQERRHWLDDDYVKFIRFAEHMIEKNGAGVFAFVTNHGYISNPTFRGMRWRLQKTFDRVYVIDLHGNANRRERHPDGSADDNVFDISVGTALLICVKNPKSDRKKRVLHRDLWGRRRQKYNLLAQQSLASLQLEELRLDPRFVMFYPIDQVLLDRYMEAFSLKALFSLSQKGIITARDHFAVDIDRNELETRLSELSDSTIETEDFRQKYFSHKSDKKYKKGDSRGWKLEEVRQDLSSSPTNFEIEQIDYRPFDRRWVSMSPLVNDWPRTDFFRHMLSRENFGLSFNRNIEGGRPFTDGLAFNVPIQHHSLSNKEANDFAPLYLYPDVTDLDRSRRVNMDPDIRAAIEKAVMKEAYNPSKATAAGASSFETPAEAAPQDEASALHRRPTEVDIFDYIYGVLHCPAYREAYAEFLKIDFPRVPYPLSAEVFWDVAAKGGELRRLHLMEPEAVGDTPYPFEGKGDNTVEVTGKKSWKPSGEGAGSVFINKTQSFQNVPEVAWEFFIGGYQPAQKWLKDRKGRVLSFEDVRHYQRIIKVLVETDRVMRTIEMPLGN